MKFAFAGIALASMYAATPAFAGPLGTHKGMAKSSITGLKEIAPSKYSSVNAPIKSSLFESYVYQFGGDGLCYVKGIGPNITTNVYGSSLKSEYDRIKTAMVDKYGSTYTNGEFLLPGSIWDEADDFMMGLLQKDRFHSSIWDIEKGAVLPDNLDTIYVGVAALRRDTGYLAIEYYYDNYDECQASVTANQTDAL